MTQEDKDRLGKTLWAIANELRGSMDADDFRDYMLSFLFLRYLSENYESVAKEELGDQFPQLDEHDHRSPLAVWYEQNKDDIEDFENHIRLRTHYIIKPQYLWENIVKMARTQDRNLLKTLAEAFQFIENESFGSSYKGLFSEINLDSDKLGKTYEQRNKRLCTIIQKIAEGLTEFPDNRDLLGDAYEYLISQFAAGSGKKAGEFYTPQEISSILSGIVLLDSQNPVSGRKTKINNILDFACGSGSLLLNIYRRYCQISKNHATKVNIYGQEKNITTYNLARMNMLLHGLQDSQFEIFHGDTLINEWPLLNEENPAKKIEFDVIVANPPFSYRWDPGEEMAEDFRFKGYGVAPKSAADFAFLLHGLHFLNREGTMAIILPHGVLFRGGAEAKIRTKLVEDGNIDTIIGLPPKLFYSTGIPVCILVLKKCKKFDDILFINASEHYEKGKRQNVLLQEHIDKIIETYQFRKEEERYSRRVSMEEIRENEYNLNISRYVSTFEPEPDIDLQQVHNDIVSADKNISKTTRKLNGFLKELGLPPLPL